MERQTGLRSWLNRASQLSPAFLYRERNSSILDSNEEPGEDANVDGFYHRQAMKKLQTDYKRWCLMREDNVRFWDCFGMLRCDPTLSIESAIYTVSQTPTKEYFPTGLDQSYSYYFSAMAQLELELVRLSTENPRLHAVLWVLADNSYLQIDSVLGAVFRLSDEQFNDKFHFEYKPGCFSGKNPVLVRSSKTSAQKGVRSMYRNKRCRSSTPIRHGRLVRYNSDASEKNIRRKAAVSRGRNISSNSTKTAEEQEPTKKVPAPWLVPSPIAVLKKRLSNKCQISKEFMKWNDDDIEDYDDVNDCNIGDLKDKSINSSDDIGSDTGDDGEDEDDDEDDTNNNIGDDESEAVDGNNIYYNHRDNTSNNNSNNKNMNKNNKTKCSRNNSNSNKDDNNITNSNDNKSSKTVIPTHVPITPTSTLTTTTSTTKASSNTTATKKQAAGKKGGQKEYPDLPQPSIMPRLSNDKNVRFSRPANVNEEPHNIDFRRQHSKYSETKFDKNASNNEKKESLVSPNNDIKWKSTLHTLKKSRYECTFLVPPNPTSEDSGKEVTIETPRAARKDTAFKSPLVFYWKTPSEKLHDSKPYPLPTPAKPMKFIKRQASLRDRREFSGQRQFDTQFKLVTKTKLTKAIEPKKDIRANFPVLKQHQKQKSRVVIVQSDVFNRNLLQKNGKTETFVSKKQNVVDQKCKLATTFLQRDVSDPNLLQQNDDTQFFPSENEKQNDIFEKKSVRLSVQIAAFNHNTPRQEVRMQSLVSKDNIASSKRHQCSMHSDNVPNLKTHGVDKPVDISHPIGALKCCQRKSPCGEHKAAIDAIGPYHYQKVLLSMIERSVHCSPNKPSTSA